MDILTAIYYIAGIIYSAVSVYYAIRIVCLIFPIKSSFIR